MSGLPLSRLPKYFLQYFAIVAALIGHDIILKSDHILPNINYKLCPRGCKLMTSEKVLYVRKY